MTHGHIRVYHERIPRATGINDISIYPDLKSTQHSFEDKDIVVLKKKVKEDQRLLFLVISTLAKFWKTFFPKEFLNEIWLKEGEYE